MKWWSDWRKKRKKSKKKKQRAKDRKKRQVARAAYHALNDIPDRFIDDGCSYSPDSIFHNEIGWACRIHDYRYCSRSMGPRDMEPHLRLAADKELRANIALSVPKWLGWIRWLYYRAVRHFGSQTSWDSCGYDAGVRCRHNLLRPRWMDRQESEKL
jgi:hypothetical protein